MCITEETKQQNHINTNNYAIENVSTLDLSQIKVYLTNQLKSEHLETLVQKLKYKLVMSTLHDHDKNRHSAHICVIFDCLINVMEVVKIVEKKQLSINYSKLS